MDDLISRQAAIDAVKKNTFRLTFAEEQGCEGHVVWSAEAVYSDVIEGALLELPSAQPETVRCKDCKHMITHEGYGYLGEPAYTCEGNMEGWVLPDSFCSHAERKDGD